MRHWSSASVKFLRILRGEIEGNFALLFKKFSTPSSHGTFAPLDGGGPSGKFGQLARCGVGRGSAGGEKHARQKGRRELPYPG